MSPRVLGRVFLTWTVATMVACGVIHHAFALAVDESHRGRTVATVWSGGEIVVQIVLAGASDSDPRLDEAVASHPGSTLVYETIVAESRVIARPGALLAFCFVPGRDGIGATWGDRAAYVTPDELLNRQAYDRGINVAKIQLSAGLDVPVAMAVLSGRLGTTVSEMIDRADLRRIRVVRTLPGRPVPRRVTAENMTDDDVRAAAIAAGRYLGRGVDPEGKFRYLVDAPTNRTLGGYDWPRHAGATYFLAQIARLSADAEVRFATLRAAGYLRDRAMVACGANRCIGDGPQVDLGSTALTVLAFVEVVRAELDPSYVTAVRDLTSFLRAQQRPDGEFMHVYDRGANRPIDVQLLYYGGEAALALSRASSLLRDPRDLDAASRAIAHLTGPAWSFFGSRYYWGEEHWTCQAMDDLWSRAPDPRALDFCIGWHAFGRKLQYGPDDSPFDADGAYGLGPVLTPRLTPVGSRTEASIATLDAAEHAGVSADELVRLRSQSRRALALLIRHQFLPGAVHLLADPAAVEGAMPGSEVDWQLRIDYAQHAGSAMVRWLELGGAAR